MMYSAVILAGGRGERFGGNKCFASLNGKKVIQYSIDILKKHVDEIIVVSHTPVEGCKIAKPGKTRQKSVYNGLKSCNNPDFVIIHDGARPFITERQVKDVKQALNNHPVVDVATKVVDGFIQDGIPKKKEGCWVSHTPEGFNYQLLLSAHEQAKQEYQDDVSLVYDMFHVKPFIVEGEYLNQKITYPQDLANAEGVLKFKQHDVPQGGNVGKVLVLGGSGGIGSAVQKLVKGHAPTRQEFDVVAMPKIDLTPYNGIVHSVAEYKNDESMMLVNFYSFVKLVKLAEKQEWKGNIVVLSSTAGTYGRTGAPVYSASKSALNAYIEARHEELATKGIYINAVAPAMVDTRLQKYLNPHKSGKSMLTPAFVAEFVVKYLDTKEHGHITFLRNS